MSYGAVSIWRQDPTLDETLRRLWAEGHPTAEIGRRMGMNKNQIIGRAHRLQLSARISPINRTGPRPEMRKPRPVQPSARPGAGGTVPPVTILPASTLSRPSAVEPRPAVTSGRPSSLNSPERPARLTNPLPVRVFLDRQCQFPRWGHKKPEEYLFCGDPVTARAGGSASPYCAKHHAVCYTMTNKEAGNPPPLRWRA